MPKGENTRPDVMSKSEQAGDPQNKVETEKKESFTFEEAKELLTGAEHHSYQTPSFDRFWWEIDGDEIAEGKNGSNTIVKVFGDSTRSDTTFTGTNATSLLDQRS
jgi:hypothetical protein